MRRDPLAARRLLVVAPHPDDETIGAWGLMRQLRLAGGNVRVIVVSDGAASHPGSRRWPPARLAAERRRETRRALASLGVTPDALRFLDLPDGGLETTAVRRALRRVLARCPAPDLIVGPVADDAHGDHRAVARAIAGLPRRGERRLGYRVWPAGASRAGCSRVSLGPSAMRIKRRVVRGYRTQGGLITDAVAGFTLTHRHLRTFAGPVERFEVLG